MKKLQAGVPVLLGLLGLFGAATAHAASAGACRSYERWVGQDRVNIVDFRGGDANSPFRFRLKVHNFEAVKSDGFMGPITRGELTFSYPRQAQPEVAYAKDAPYPASYTRGPAFGERVKYQAREVACNVFEVHWKEPNKGDTVTHVQDFNRQHVCTNITNITNINRQPIPASFDPLDLDAQLNNKLLLTEGSPLDKDSFGWFNLCGRMARSHEGERAWERLGFLVYEAK
jgi:hypothetical protein